MKIIAHKIGNKINGEPLVISQEELFLNEDLSETLQNYFLGSFKSEETFNFYSDSYLSNNTIFNSVSEIFLNPTEFLVESENIAKHLYDSAENPRIQSGELFVVFFPKQSENDFEKIGIFKTEKRESFLKFFSTDESLDIEKDKGVSLSKIDKAALIFNTNQENGYIINVVDNNKNGDMYYWFEDFLKVKQREDEYFHTQETLLLIKDFIKKQLPQEFEVSQINQADFLNKSIEFIKNCEHFNLTKCLNEVFNDEGVMESFTNYKSDLEQEMKINISEDFTINNSAVKKQQRHFKSIIKLDKNFHIYVHGDSKLIQQGNDESGKFYKVYFENES